MLLLQEPFVRLLGEFIPALRHHYQQVLRAGCPGELRHAQALCGVVPVSFRRDHESSAGADFRRESLDKRNERDRAPLPEAMADPLQHLTRHARVIA